MSEHELMLKTNNELSAIANDLVSKLKMLTETDKASPKRAEYFEDLQTVMKIMKQRTG